MGFRGKFNFYFAPPNVRTEVSDEFRPEIGDKSITLSI